MEHKKKTSVLIVFLIIAAGFLYAQMPGTTPFGFFKKPAISCGGDVVGGHCWYLGAEGNHCNTTCSSHGGCDLTGTRDYAGSGGTNANCIAVLTAIGAPGSWGATTTNSAGCQLSSGEYKRGTSTTTCSVDITSTQRACACNN